MASIKYKTEDGFVSIPMTVPTKSNEENGNGIGTCSTSSGTALTVSLTGYELVLNGFVAVTFSNDVLANSTLNVNGKGAKPIYYKGSAIEADTIKADDTVMFCYNGSQYVVTSLDGGGGGTIVWPEFVTISLTQLGGNNSDLIGATVIVTNDDTSETILSTTWQGSDIGCTVEAGTNYTITVGSVTDYFLPASQSYTAISGRFLITTFTYNSLVVDLGLPSGLKWSAVNVGAQNPWDRGLYFSWGNVEGHQYGSDYYFTSQQYASTPGSALSADIQAGSTTYDAASAVMGGTWKMPSKDNWAELINNTDYQYLTDYHGIKGFKFMNKSNHDIFIFIPQSGYYQGGALPTDAFFMWSRSYGSSTQAYNLVYNGVSLNPNDSTNRYVGSTIRAIK